MGSLLSPPDNCGECLTSEAAITATPYRVVPDGTDGVRAWYRCSGCGHRWWTSWLTRGMEGYWPRWDGAPLDTFTDRHGAQQDATAVIARIACKDCPAEVRHTGWRFRVIHEATCPTWQRYARKLPGYTAVPSGVIVRAGEKPPEGTTALLSNSGGAIPCGTSVTHRGPYKRAPATPEHPRRSA